MPCLALVARGVSAADAACGEHDGKDDYKAGVHVDDVSHSVSTATEQVAFDIASVAMLTFCRAESVTGQVLVIDGGIVFH